MAEQLLDENIRAQLSEFLQKLSAPVKVLYFGTETDCGSCEDTRKLVHEVASLSEKIDLNEHDLNKDGDLSNLFKVDKAPMLVIAGLDGGEIVDYGIRFSGIPAGHEFSSFIHVLLMVSNRESALRESTRQYLHELTDPVHLQIFVTPTCPYCPRAVILAYQMALESPLVYAEAVDAIEFPELANRYQVSGVPQTTINFGAGTVIGAVAEEDLLNEIQSALAEA